jgi:hypothetical protein
MHLMILPIGGETAVQGTFTHTARVVGDALLYGVVRKASDPPYFGATSLPDAGDNAPPGIEVQWPVLAGLTSTGRMVVVFRSGEQGPVGWTGRSILYAAIGAASPLREAGQSIVVETTQPGPIGPQGPQGETGPQGLPGAAGAAGEDAVALTDADIDRIALRVWTMPPPPEYRNISGADLGALSQEVIAYNDTQRQDVKQLEIRRYDEAALNLLREKYRPLVGGAPPAE